MIQQTSSITFAGGLLDVCWIVLNTPSEQNEQVHDMPVMLYISGIISFSDSVGC